MSGTGKSSALAELEKRGFEVVDTDHDGWTECVVVAQLVAIALEPGA
jgi:predicted ATPase